MILSNVNIGTGPSAGDGDPLRSAFTIINNNFQIIENNVNALTNSVTSVAGRTGNVILTVNDIVGLNSTYATQANITAANVGMRGYVDSKITANIALLVNSAPSTLDTIRELADAIGDDPNFAVNIALSVSTANTKMRSYVDGQILAANAGVTAANLGMKGYVDSQIGGTYSNINVLSYLTTNSYTTQTYVDLANTIQSAQVNAANLATIAANLGMKGYVDSVASQSIYGNVNVQAYTETMGFSNFGNVNVAAYVTTANSAIVGYIDLANTIQSQQIASANIGIIGYVDQANTIQSAQVNAANLAIVAANLGMKGYVDSVASQSIYGNGNVKSYLTQFDGNIVPSANAVYSLGSITNQWKELFVSNTTIYIGGIPISLTDENGLSIDGNLILTGLGDETVALGKYAGGINYGGGVSPSLYGNQGDRSTAVGPNAGKMAQGANCVAVGSSAGGESQGNANISLGFGGAIAVGGGAGIEAQGYHSVSVGYYPAQGPGSGANVSLPYFRGQTLQGNGAVSLGAYAGASNQGDNAVAIGYRAGISSQYPNSIVINASGNDLDSNVSGLIISPVRMDNSNVANVVYYNTTTKEMTYGPAAGGSSNYGNVNVKAYTESMGYQNYGNVNVSALITTNGLTNYSNVNVIAYLAGNITVGNIAGSVDGYSIGYRDVPQITVANLTLIASDAGKHYYGANTNPTTITIPTNADVAFGNGTAISIVNQGTGNITVANAAGVLLYLAGNTTAGSRTLTSYGMATLIKVQVNTWFINGTGVV